MKRESTTIAKSEWNLIVDCPFNGSKANLADSGIVLNGTGSFASDPVASGLQVAKFTSHSDRFTISTSDFSLSDINSCKVELDFYCIGAAYYNNIVDTSGSGGKGLFTQYESPNWFFAIENVSEAGQGTSGQRMKLTSSQIPFGNWYHLMLSKHNGIETVYVKDTNGNVIGSLVKENLADANSQYQFSIGSGNNYARPLNGYIKNFKLYKHIW